MKLKLMVLFLFVVSSVFTYAQTQSIYPEFTAKEIKRDKTIPLRDMVKIPVAKSKWEKDGVPNKTGLIQNFDYEGEDEVKQITPAYRSNTGTIKNFEGIPNRNGVYPPDTQGDVGPNHYIQMLNISFQIWDKEGNSLYGPVNNSTLWNGFGDPWDGSNDGDPIVLYDELADRWVFSQFALPYYPDGPFYELIAVSETSDPLGAWYRYSFEFNHMPDYPKLSVWPDGYYLTVNQFTSGSLSFRGGAIAVLERSKMLNGEEAEMVFFDLGIGASSLLPAHVDGTAPPANSPNYLMCLLGSSAINYYSLTVNWNTPANSVLSAPASIPVTAFNSNFSQDVPQPGTTRRLDIIEGRLMFPLQYRNFGTYEAMVTNHTVNVGSNRAGVRWYEFRKSGGSWTLYQQGTYAPASDSHCRWMGSINMDSQGNIALGYSVSSSTVYPSIRATGRLVDDPLGEMTLDEIEIMTGSGSQTGTDGLRSRWGDYSGMSVDPSDDLTFWYTTEYYQTTSWSGWRTRIASFQIASSLNSSMEIKSGWNLLSVPLNTTDMTVAALFPDAVSNAFEYDGIYNTVTTLENGKGYWLQFDADENANISGAAVTGDVAVNAGWNIIGPFHSSVPVANIITSPAAIFESDFFEYNGVYSTVSTLSPGKGYWIKVSQAGTLDIGATLKLGYDNKPAEIQTAVLNIPLYLNDGTNKKDVVLYAGVDPDATDGIDRSLGESPMPPKAPFSFDARFEFPSAPEISAMKDFRFSKFGEAVSIEHTISYSLTSGSDGLTINFNLPAGVKMNIRDGVNGTIINKNYSSGKGIFTDPATKGLNSLKITINYDKVIPLEFSSLSAKPVNDAVEIIWTGANLSEGSRYEIQRSEDSYVYGTIGYIDCESSVQPINYSYRDESAVNGIYYYRIKLTDRDGNYSLSNAIETELNLPADYELSQNYPNPFNPVTTIKFSLPVQSDVSLKVYDILGNEIAVLAEGFRMAGRHRVEFNGANLASGVYIYRLTAESMYGTKFTESKKLVLMK